MIGDLGAKEIASALKENDSLPEDLSINLSYNNLGDIGIRTIADAIKDNNKLPRNFFINFDNNQIDVAGAQVNGYAKFRHNIKR